MADQETLKELVVKMILDATGVKVGTADAQRVIASIKPVLKETETAVKESESAFSALGKEIGGTFLTAAKQAVVAYLGFEVIRKVTDFMMDARLEAKEWTKAQNALNVAMGYMSTGMREQAEALSKKLLIDDAEIKTVQARLAIYVKNEDQIKSLTPQVLNLSKALGIDFGSAASLVGRSIGKNTEELGRFGIKIEGAADSTERINSLIASLSKSFGGQADAAVKAADSIDKISFAWKQFKESIGKQVFGKGEQTSFLEEIDLRIAAQKEKLDKMMSGSEDIAIDKMLEQITLLTQMEKKREEYWKTEQEKISASAARGMNLDPFGLNTEQAIKDQDEKEKKAWEDRKKTYETEKKWLADFRKDEQDKAKADFDAKIKDLKDLNDKYDAEDKKEKTTDETKHELAKKTTESQKALTTSEIQFKIDGLDKLSKNEKLSDALRMQYARAASDERKSLIMAEAEYSQQALDEEAAKMKDQFPELAAEIDATFSKMKSDVSAKAKIESNAVVTVTIDEKKTAQEVQKAVQMWTTGASNSMNAAVSLFTAATSQDIEKAVQNIGGAVAGAGESAGNSWVAAAGSIIQGIGTVFQVLDQNFDIWGNQERARRSKLDKERIEQYTREENAMAGTKRIVDDWLETMGLIDPSNMSKKQLEKSAVATAEKQKEEFGKATGIDVSGIDAVVLQKAMKEYTPGGIFGALDAEWNGTEDLRDEILKKYPELKGMFDKESITYKKDKFGGYTTKSTPSKDRGVLNSQATAAWNVYDEGELAQTSKSLSSQIANYDYASGIDHTKSNSKEDYESDLDVEETTGIITAKQHAEYLYEGSKAGGKFADYYDQPTRAKYAYDYLNYDALHQNTTSISAGSTIPTFGDGGFTSGLSIAGEGAYPEAVIPLDPSKRGRAASILDQVDSIMGGISSSSTANHNITLLIDPNIPMNRNFANQLSEQIAERVLVTTRARGGRR